MINKNLLNLLGLSGCRTRWAYRPKNVFCWQLCVKAFPDYTTKFQRTDRGLLSSPCTYHPTLVPSMSNNCSCKKMELPNGQERAVELTLEKEKDCALVPLSSEYLEELIGPTALFRVFSFIWQSLFSSVNPTDFWWLLKSFPHQHSSHHQASPLLLEAVSWMESALRTLATQPA